MFPLRGPLLAVAAVLSVVVGVGTGIASIAVHEKSWAWFLLAVAAPVAFALALRPGWIRAGFCLGWIGLLLVAIQGRPQGDYVIMSTLRGYLLLTCMLVLIVLVMATLPARRRLPESEESGNRT